MDKIWEIIEHRREGSSESGMRGMKRSGYYGRRMSGMKGYESEDFKKGVKEGFCAALEMLEEAAESFDRE